MLEIGEPAPDFSLTADDGSTVSLSDYLGQKVVLYFYPKADTAGCTRQACAVRDAYGDIDAGGAVVLGLSPDMPPALAKFREKYGLNFPLLSDPDHAVAEAYGAWSGRIVRSHFAVDAEGNLTEQKLKVKPETTAELALRLIEL